MAVRAITVKNKQKTLRDQFWDSFTTARKNTSIVDYSYEKANHYKGEF